MKLQLPVAFQQLLVHDLQAPAIILVQAAGLFHLLDRHCILNRNRNDAGKHRQQIQVPPRELAFADLVDCRNATKKMFLALQRNHDQRARLFFPAIALFIIEFGQNAPPPGFFMFPYPAADTVVQRQ